MEAKERVEVGEEHGTRRYLWLLVGEGDRKTGIIEGIVIVVAFRLGND